MGTGQSIGKGLLWALASPLAMGCYRHWPVHWQPAAMSTGQSIGNWQLQALASPLALCCYGHWPVRWQLVAMGTGQSIGIVLLYILASPSEMDHWPVHLQQVTGQHWLAHQQRSSVKLILPSTTEKVTEHAVRVA